MLIALGDWQKGGKVGLRLNHLVKNKGEKRQRDERPRLRGKGVIKQIGGGSTS